MESDEKPRIDIHPNDPRRISEIADAIDIPMGDVESELRKNIRRHYNHFGTRPVKIEYDPTVGEETVTPRSIIGYLNMESFVLRIQSKIPGLSIGKCLGLAQKCGHNRFSKYRDEMERHELSDKENYDTLDFFAISFLSIVSRIIQNGLDKNFEQTTAQKSKFGGEIDLDESIQNGTIDHSPVIRDSELVPDTEPNRILKGALAVCQNESRSEKVAGWAASLDPYFEEVGRYDPQLIKDIDGGFSVPRQDYELGLQLADMILKGSDVDIGEEAGFLPFFTLDMNQVFQDYVSFALADLLNEEKYDVHIEREYSHSIEPELTRKKFVPDIIVQNAEENRVVLDAKNKYECVEDESTFKVRNDDLFQLSYYGQSLESRFGILLYPGSDDQASQYAIKKSESNYNYRRRRDRRFETLQEQNFFRLFPNVDAEVVLIKWVVDVTGTIHNTKTNMAHLAQLIADLMEGVHDDELESN